MAEVIYRKETDWDKKFDYQAPGELMVCITLAEYRQLVKENGRATEEVNHERTKKYAVEKELEEAKEKIKKLIFKYETQHHSVFGSTEGICKNEVCK